MKSTALLIIVLCCTSTLNAGVVDSLGLTTVYLYRDSVRTEVVGKDTCEIWVKNITKKTEQPSTVSLSGTGFLILFHDVFYIVTAEHVAKSMTDDALIVTNASDTTLSVVINQSRI